jgi:hypothetical protein
MLTETCAWLYVKCPAIFVRCNHNYNMSANVENYPVSDFMQTHSDVVDSLRGNRTGETSRRNLPVLNTNVPRVTIKRTLVIIKGCDPPIIINCLASYHDITGAVPCLVGCNKSTADRTFAPSYWRSGVRSKLFVTKGKWSRTVPVYYESEVE